MVLKRDPVLFEPNLAHLLKEIIRKRTTITRMQTLDLTTDISVGCPS